MWPWVVGRWVVSGDGGSQGDPWNLSQNIRSLFGKMMRVNVNKLPKGRNFTVPWSNPFRGRGNPLVFALGFRNPWRCDQDPYYGTIVCGDVGAVRPHPSTPHPMPALGLFLGPCPGACSCIYSGDCSWADHHLGTRGMLRHRL